MAVLALLRRGALLAAWTLALAGCTFSRTIVNAHQAELDSHWIEPGKTTLAEVVAKWGLPPMVQGVTGYRSDALHYVSVDATTVRLEVGYLVTPTFERTQRAPGDDVLVTFDEAGVVAHVSHTRTRQNLLTGERTTDVLDLRGRP